MLLYIKYTMKRGLLMSDKYTPCVIVPGIGQSKVELVDCDGKKIKMAWQLDVDTEMIVKELKMPLASSILLRRDAGLSKKMKSVIAEVVDPIATKDDGTMKNHVRVVTYPQSLAQCTEDERAFIYRMVPMQRLSKIIGEENMYFFAYNSFGEPYETAKDLNDFIQKIKKERGCDKVNLVPVSLGGAVSIAYFDAYGSQNDIKRVMYFVAALQGTPVISDLMAMNIKADKALSLVEFLFPRKVAELLGKVLGMLPEKVANNFMYNSIEGILEPAIVRCPSMWSTIPPEKYGELSQKYLSDKKYSVLKEKTDRFYKAQKNFPEYVKTLMAQGTEFFAITGYNLPLMPIVASDTISSDSMINIQSASLGATAAPLGQKLNAENSEFISPDGTIDASTSLFGDRVWYFKDQQHDNTAYNDTALDVAARVLSDDSFVSVHSDPALPRFGNVQDNRK